jgi:hypothetical protein
MQETKTITPPVMDDRNAGDMASISSRNLERATSYDGFLAAALIEIFQVKVSALLGLSRSILLHVCIMSTLKFQPAGGLEYCQAFLCY